MLSLWLAVQQVRRKEPTGVLGHSQLIEFQEGSSVQQLKSLQAGGCLDKIWEPLSACREQSTLDDKAEVSAPRLGLTLKQTMGRARQFPAPCCLVK